MDLRADQVESCVLKDFQALPNARDPNSPMQLIFTDFRPQCRYYLYTRSIGQGLLCSSCLSVLSCLWYGMNTHYPKRNYI